MVIADYYSSYRFTAKENNNYRHLKMTTTFPHPSLSDENSMESSSFKTALLEPFLILVVGLFWAAALPITGIFCASVAIYDRICAPKSSEFRLRNLNSSLAKNPPASKQENGREVSSQRNALLKAA